MILSFESSPIYDIFTNRIEQSNFYHFYLPQKDHIQKLQLPSYTSHTYFVISKKNSKKTIYLYISSPLTLKKNMFIIRTTSPGQLHLTQNTAINLITRISGGASCTHVPRDRRFPQALHKFPLVKRLTNVCRTVNSVSREGNV